MTQWPRVLATPAEGLGLDQHSPGRLKIAYSPSSRGSNTSVSQGLLKTCCAHNHIHTHTIFNNNNNNNPSTWFKITLSIASIKVLVLVKPHPDTITYTEILPLLGSVSVIIGMVSHFGFATVFFLYGHCQFCH